MKFERFCKKLLPINISKGYPVSPDLKATIDKQGAVSEKPEGGFICRCMVYVGLVSDYLNYTY